MINLLAAYYENIWPFKGTCCSLFFDEWKYLIKAPIWSWKSFLFFDSPRYALYKDSSRNMLNLQSKNWEISLIFEVDSVYYLVKRILKSTKMWNDSCSSQLYLINYDWDNLLKDIKELTWGDELLQRNVNFLKLFEKENWNKWKTEEVLFKNETDFQLALEDLLPPKEVFLSTVFLLQDADNIFEMRPADRLIVLKNVFNLLGIDDAKEKVQDKKKEVQYKLKALQDHSLQDEKLRTNLKWLRENIKELEKDHELQIILSSNDQFFYDIEWFLDQISLINFSLNWLDLESLTKSEKIVQEKIDAVVKLDTQISENEKQISSIESQQKQVSDDIVKLKNNILDLQKKIESIDVKKWTELKNKKMQLFQKWNTINESADYSGLDDFISFWNENIIDREDIKRIEKPNNLKWVYDILQTAKEVWVQIKSEIEFKNSKLENLELQSKRWKENHDREIERLKELKSRKEEEIKQQQIRIKELDEMWAKNSDFDCPDLCKKCPHINAINKQQFEQYSQQKEKLNQILDSLKVDFDNESYDEKLKLMESEKNSAGDIEQIKIKDEIKNLWNSKTL